MNSFINLNQITKENNSIRYSFCVSDNLSKYFTNTDFVIEYPESVESVPDSVVAVPFVCNVLPIIWLTDSVLELDELDKTFYESIPEFKKGYIDMYPNAQFKGCINARRIVDNSYPDTGKSAMFYSGGLDSAQTLISHLDEKPILISIWGSDIRYDNGEGWRIVHSAIEEATEKFGLSEVVFRSTFREFDNEGRLHSDYLKKLGDGWWHGVKHSIGLIGHVAPYAFLHKISKMYIAATNCSKYPPMTCASDPRIDNYVKFTGCSVFHDGYDYSRQDKIHNLINFCKNHSTTINLHVCWITQTGSNCCICEKCYRTMMGIWAENEDPSDYGFSQFDCTCITFLDFFVDFLNRHGFNMYFYPEIQKTTISNKKQLRLSPYYKDLKWFLKVDFSDLNNVKMPLSYTIKSKVSRFRLYQFASGVMHRFRGYNI